MASKWSALSFWRRKTHHDYDPIHGDGKGAPKKGARDGADRRNSVDQQATLPPELWNAVLRMVDAPEDRFLLARVCHAWRVLIVAQDAAIKGRRRIRTGAAACRMRLALAAIEADNDGTLSWALASLETRLDDAAADRLWDAILVKDRLVCAAVLREGARWPLVCCAAGCECRKDPQWCRARRSTVSGKGAADCRRSALIVRAYAMRRLALADLLIDWGVAHPQRWANTVFTKALAAGDLQVIEHVWDRFETYISHGNRLAVAARHNRVDVMEWLQARMPSGTEAEDALRGAAAAGAMDAVVWLCERQHVDAFCLAFVEALARRRLRVARRMLGYIEIVRVHLEGKGLTIAGALGKASEGHKLVPDAAALLASVLASEAARGGP